MIENIDLVKIIEDEVNSAIGGDGAGSGSYGGGSNPFTSEQLSIERAMELDYYNGQPFGNEREGESQVVSSDVFDAVESMLPHLMKTFTASDDAVEFEPVGMEDEEAAKQRTDACNYVFYKQNNGFILMYTWFKDALLQKNGIVKYWWDKSIRKSEEEYAGLTEGEYLTLVRDQNVEVLEHSTYDDPTAAGQKAQMIEKLQAQAQANPQAAQLLQQISQAPVPQLHDIKVVIERDESKICIQPVPPEQFGISAKHTCISIQDTPFCYHREKKTFSDLKEMGCPDSILEEIEADDPTEDARPEVLARNRFIDESATTITDDDSLREVWVVDCFIRLDVDGDGIAELRHIIMPGRTIWINEPCEHINFAAITPIIMPHRWIGKSVAETVMDFQFQNSVLLRQMFNNLYLTNNPQKVVLGTAGGQVFADLDRLMTSRVGGILVEYQPNAIRNQEVPFVAAASFPMLEYLEGKKEQRTGNTRYNQGTDADSLNKTARGISLIQSAAQQKIDLVARIFAETGVKDLFRGIAYMLSKYSSKAMTIRLRGKWVDIDPREWKNQFDMTVNVGLGTGNKDAQLIHLTKMAELHLQLIQTGRGYMVTDENAYNLTRKITENMGFKHPDIFITNPQQVQKPPPQPNPDMIKIQAETQIDQAKIQSNEKIRQFDAQTQKTLEEIKAQTQLAIADIDRQTKLAIADMQVKAQVQIALFKENNALKEEATRLEVEKQGLGYESNLLSLKKQIDSEKQKKQDQVIVDTTGAVSTGIGESMGAVAQGIQEQAQILQQQTGGMQDAIRVISEGMQSQAQALAQTLKSISDQQKQSAMLLSSVLKMADEKKAPRKHKVREVDGGYEITSTIQ